MERPYTITFFYYEDIHAVASFYASVMGFELVLDQGLAQIFRAAPGAFLGIVDGSRGHLRHQDRSAVLFTIVDDDVEGWHSRMKTAGGHRSDGDHSRPLLRPFLLRRPRGLCARGATIP